MNETRIDASNQILGRLASRLALLLRNKISASFQPNKLPQNRVIVYNTDSIRFTGNKLNTKKYYRHSEYPGSLKEIKLKDKFKKNSRLVLKMAVLRMLPKNRQQQQIIKNLILYKKEA